MGELRRTGCTIDAIAERVGLAPARVQLLLRLTHLGPVALRAVFTGGLAEGASLGDLIAAADHFEWSVQNRFLRLAGPRPA